MSSGIYVNGPSWIDSARVHVQRENEMLFGGAAIWRGERVNKKCARAEVHDWRTGDPNRVDVTASEVA